MSIISKINYETKEVSDSSCLEILLILQDELDSFRLNAIHQLVDYGELIYKNYKFYFDKNEQ
jgi:hypothetical protein